MTDFGPDRCKGCGAEYVGSAGAFACGYPLADCGAMIAEAEEAEYVYQGDVLQAEEIAFHALMEQVMLAGCSEEDALAMDALEAELDAKLLAHFGPDPDPNEDAWEKVELQPLVIDGKIDIPF